MPNLFKVELGLLRSELALGVAFDLLGTVHARPCIVLLGAFLFIRTPLRILIGLLGGA